MAVRTASSSLAAASTARCRSELQPSTAAALALSFFFIPSTATACFCSHWTGVIAVLSCALAAVSALVSGAVAVAVAALQGSTLAPAGDPWSVDGLVSAGLVSCRCRALRREGPVREAWGVCAHSPSQGCLRKPVSTPAMAWFTQLTVCLGQGARAEQQR